jgi:hypothetical protein
VAGRSVAQEKEQTIDTYTKTDTFDIETGMAVYGANGEKIGSVTEIGGFGSTRVGLTSMEEGGERITEARTGTGYFKVALDREGAKGLVVPFHGIQHVTPGHGVTLKDAVITELPHQAEATDPGAAKVEETPRRRWTMRWPGKRQ